MTSLDYLKISIANAFGLDKVNYAERIDWVDTHKDELELQKAEEPYLYKKAVLAYKDYLANKPIGYIVHLDAICSGIQVLSALTKCKTGLKNSGLINTGKREDAYLALHEEMVRLLPNEDISFTRKECKEALMTGAYGSQAVPKRIFGNKLLPTFYTALNIVCPGAVSALDVLLDAWQSDKEVNAWYLPDGHYVYIPNLLKYSDKVEIDELNHAQLSVVYSEVGTQDSSISLPANVTHSVDALVLREVIRASAKPTGADIDVVSLTKYTLETGFVSLVWQNVNPLFIPHEIYNEVMEDKRLLVKHETFPISTVHDSFGVHPNNCATIQFWHKRIMAKIADSNILESIYNQIAGEELYIETKEENLHELIMQSEYSIS